jgi:CxxC-x17-CxxC domain-containing protein
MYPRKFGPTKQHKAVCSECGEEFMLPYEPSKGKMVVCRECAPVHRRRPRY